jgi:hypothetical protein
MSGLCIAHTTRDISSYLILWNHAIQVAHLSRTSVYDDSIKVTKAKKKRCVFKQRYIFKIKMLKRMVANVNIDSRYTEPTIMSL